jgi:hypothetical protein
MINALKMTAERMALWGEARCIKFKRAQLGIGGSERRRDDREVFRNIICR